MVCGGYNLTAGINGKFLHFAATSGLIARTHPNLNTAVPFSGSQDYTILAVIGQADLGNRDGSLTGLHTGGCQRGAKPVNKCNIIAHRVSRWQNFDANHLPCQCVKGYLIAFHLTNTEIEL